MGRYECLSKDSSFPFFERPKPYDKDHHKSRRKMIGTINNLPRLISIVPLIVTSVSYEQSRRNDSLLVTGGVRGLFARVFAIPGNLRTILGCL